MGGLGDGGTGRWGDWEMGGLGDAGGLGDGVTGRWGDWEWGLLCILFCLYPYGGIDMKSQ